MKLLGQLLILFTGLIFGLWGIKREESYINLIEELQLGLAIIENEISFALKPLPVAFHQAAKVVKKTKPFFVEAAKRAQNGEACLFDMRFLPCKEEEQRLLSEVGIRLGRGSEKDQTALILKALSRLEASRLKYRERLQKVTPLWRWLSPLTALLVVLLTC